MKHVHGMIVFGIILSVIPIPFYIWSATSGNIAGLAAGISLQVSGAVLISLSRAYAAKLKNAPST